MAPVAEQTVRRLAEGADEVDAADRAGRALGLLALEAADEGRSRVALGEPPRDQADDPHRPARVAEDDRGSVVGDLRHPLLGLDHGPGHRRLAVDVLPLEPAGDRLGLGGRGGEEQAQGELGILHPAGGVDPRREPEGEIGGTERAPHPRGGAERGEPGRRGGGERLEPTPDDQAVLTAQRHHVGHGAEGGEAEGCVGAPRRDDPLGLERGEELPGHPRPREGVERVGAVRALGVDEGVHLGQRCRGDRQPPDLRQVGGARA